MRIAARSTAIGGGSEAAVGRVLDALELAAAGGVELLVLPELCLTGVARDGGEARRLAEELEERGIEDIGAAASSRAIAVVAGRYAIRGGEVVNRAELICPDGRRAAYDKLHRFDALGARESELVAAGGADAANLAVTELGGLLVGQVTCFDLRFPELALALADRGAQVLAAGAAWYDGAGKAEQLELVARARAADVGAVVAVAAALGEGFAGSSVLAGPDGAVLAQGELAVADVDAALVDAQRERLPLSAMRRLRP